MTRIKYMTEGTLIREMMRDPLLSVYSVIMLDEAHERLYNSDRFLHYRLHDLVRTLFLDVVVGLLYKIQKKRKDLRIIISSATLDAELFKDFFNTNETNNPAKDTAGILRIEVTTLTSNLRNNNDDLTLLQRVEPILWIYITPCNLWQTM